MASLKLGLQKCLNTQYLKVKKSSPKRAFLFPIFVLHKYSQIIDHPNTCPPSKYASSKKPLFNIFRSCNRFLKPEISLIKAKQTSGPNVRLVGNSLTQFLVRLLQFRRTCEITIKAGFHDLRKKNSEIFQRKNEEPEF